MEVTWVGGLLLLATPALTTVLRKFLYPLAVFAIPFSATAVVNVQRHGEGSGVQLYLALATLWMIGHYVCKLRAGSTGIRRCYAVSECCLLGFVLVAGASLFVPALLHGRVYITEPILSGGFGHELSLTSRHLTQFGYLLLGVLFAHAISSKTAGPAGLRTTLRAYALGATALAAWGWMQWGAYLFGFPYPAGVLNTSASRSALGYQQILEDLGVARISSAAVEPSILAQSLLVIYPILLVSIATRYAIIGPVADGVATVLIASVLLLSTSTSAYIGLLLCTLLTVWALCRRRALRPAKVYGALGLVTLVSLGVTTAVPAASTVLRTMIVEKWSSYSAAERFLSVAQAWEYATRYPIFGLGWGSVTSHDLFVSVLANVGIIGLVALSLFFAALLYGLRSKEALPRRLTQLGAWQLGLRTSLVMQMVLWTATGFPYVFGHLWLLVGLALGFAHTRHQLPPADRCAEPETVSSSCNP